MSKNIIAAWNHSYAHLACSTAITTPDLCLGIDSLHSYANIYIGFRTLSLFCANQLIQISRNKVELSKRKPDEYVSL